MSIRYGMAWMCLKGVLAIRYAWILSGNDSEAWDGKLLLHDSRRLEYLG